jgi:3-dehydroquinate dehydratase-2
VQRRHDTGVEIAQGRHGRGLRAHTFAPMIAATEAEAPMNPILILNGPNLNLLGQREPQLYGTRTLADIEQLCQRTAGKLGFEVRCHQTNREYELIELIHAARGATAGIVINPAAFTHTSVAILDALAAYEGPVVEVHVSNIHKREAFRHHSFVSLRADAVIAGAGVQGYAFAVERVVHLARRADGRGGQA